MPVVPFVPGEDKEFMNLKGTVKSHNTGVHSETEHAGHMDTRKIETNSAPSNKHDRLEA